MPNNEEEIVKNLKVIKFLLAGILLGRKPNVKQVAKIINCSDNTLTNLYPDKKKKGKTEIKDGLQEGLIEDKENGSEKEEL